MRLFCTVIDILIVEYSMTLIWGNVRSRLLKMAPIDRSYTTSYCLPVIAYAVTYISYNDTQIAEDHTVRLLFILSFFRFFNK